MGGRELGDKGRMLGRCHPLVEDRAQAPSIARHERLAVEPEGRPRDAKRLPPPRGNGFWTQEIYYHILNCGLRIPPSAGSASGVLNNPVGYNRVYVHLGPDCSYARWWEGLRAGRSFVTNGPLLRVQAGGQLPGHVFSSPGRKELVLEVKAALTTREPIRFLCNLSQEPCPFLGIVCRTLHQRFHTRFDHRQWRLQFV